MADNNVHARELHMQKLFGGAVKIMLPQSFVDVSNYRPVPDHQEVWTDAEVDQSVLIEIVEHQAASNVDCLQLYFQDLAEQNQAAFSQIQDTTTLSSEHVPHLPAAVFKGLVTGLQSVSKGRQGPEAANDVQVQLAVFRFPEYQTDVLVSLNSPSYIAAESAAAPHTGAGQKTTHLDAPALFLSILQTIDIKNYGLFG